MNLKPVTEKRLFRPAVGAVLTVLCGMALWKMPLGEPWRNASYDYLFRFGARGVTNQVVLVLADNEAYAYERLARPRPGEPAWDRALHANLLNKLADDGCPLVVFDFFFRGPGEESKDQALVQAMRRLPHVVLMAEQAGVQHPGIVSAEPTPPGEPFLSAAKTNWGVAFLDPDLDGIVRRHWPYPAPVLYESLPRAAARLAGAQTSEAPEWLRYYGPDGAWTALSYHLALEKGAQYFRDKIVFIGNKPKTSVPDRELDKFQTPYTRWTGYAAGGTEIMATAFLNLVNGEWLRRAPVSVELGILVGTGVVFGCFLCCVRRLTACALAVVAGLAVTLGAVWFSHVVNFWFPWLVIVGGQMPCALAWAILAPIAVRKPETTGTAVIPAGPTQDLPEAPDYELFSPAFSEGAYGKVWLVRNAIGQWQALKTVYLARFHPHVEPYEREFTGIKRYKPISDKHPGLLRVDFISTKKSAGYFYYVMELGDALESGWEQNPTSYRPRDLANLRTQYPDRRLPTRECLRIALALSEALDFLHCQGLTHRDIKPQNIIFVNNQPKLADVGLVAEILPPDKERTWVGTPGYMPPPPEPPGTPQADIYELGMVLYVILTGHDPAFFPELSTTLIEGAGRSEFMVLNSIIVKACQPDLKQRFTTAADMRQALLEAQKFFAAGAAPS